MTMKHQTRTHAALSISLALLAALLILPACAGPTWQSSYQPLSTQGTLLPQANRSDAPRSNVPPLNPADRVELKRLPLEQISLGQIPSDCTALGFAEFQRPSPGTLQDETDLLNFARNIGSDRVLWGTGFSHRTTTTEYETVSGPRPWDRWGGGVSSDTGAQLYSTPVTKTNEWYTLRALFLRSKQSQ
jgi:hypothetical protein